MVHPVCIPAALDGTVGAKAGRQRVQPIRHPALLDFVASGHQKQFLCRSFCVDTDLTFAKTEVLSHSRPRGWRKE
jgi:hypothetical protein